MKKIIISLLLLQLCHIATGQEKIPVFIAYFDRKLIDPVYQGSLLLLGKKTIAFSNAADEIRRDNLTARISHDEGNMGEEPAG